MASNSVSVKVFLMKDEKRIVVRRIEIQKDAVLHYDYLRDRFQSFMPELHQQSFKLLWTDSDGDEVTISSDEELLIAVSELGDSSLKFIVRLEPKVSNVAAAAENANPTAFMQVLKNFLTTPLFCDQMQAELFTQRVCNSCSELITSTSFKCLQCPYFYQCDQCDLKNTHTNHIMLRVSKDWADQQKVHREYFLGQPKRDAMDDLRKKLKYYEEEHKKQIPGGYGRRTRKHNRRHSPIKGLPTSDDSWKEFEFASGRYAGLGNMINSFLDFVIEPAQVAEVPTAQSSNAKEPQDVFAAEPTAQCSNANEPQDVVADEPTAQTSNAKEPQKVFARRPRGYTTEEDEDEDDDSAPIPSTTTLNVKLNSALETLAEMGFHNDQQWLTHLLEHNSYDLAKTIDLLTSNK